jgi:hypothetical protein
VRLAVFYPHPNNPLPIWQVTLATRVSPYFCDANFLAKEASLRPYWMVLVCRHAGAGHRIVQIGEQGHADRYTYLPHIGLFLLIVWTAADLQHAGIFEGSISGLCSDDHRSFKLSRGCPDLVLEK